MMIPVSPGELLDKIAILRIKAGRITDPVRLANVRHELEPLEIAWSAAGVAESVDAEMAELALVNSTLWDIESRIRSKERELKFDEEFIGLARSVYAENDRRATIKRRINEMLGSRIVEEKLY